MPNKNANNTIIYRPIQKKKRYFIAHARNIIPIYYILLPIDKNAKKIVILSIQTSRTDHCFNVNYRIELRETNPKRNTDTTFMLLLLETTKNWFCKETKKLDATFFLSTHLFDVSIQYPRNKITFDSKSFLLLFFGVKLFV